MTTLDLLELAIAHASSQLRVALPARVTRVDRERGRVSVEVGITPPRPGPEDGEVEYDQVPDLLDVPVLMPGSAAVEVSLAIAPGDAGLLVFADFPLGEWLRSGRASRAPADPHGTSGAVFVPGLWPSGEGPALPESGARVGMRGGGPRVEVSASAVEVKSGGAAAALALLSELQSMRAWLATHTHLGVTTGAGTSGVAAQVAALPVPTGTVVLKGQ